MEQMNQAVLGMMQMVTAGKSQRTESGNRTGKDENAKDFGAMLRDRQTADNAAETAQDTVKVPTGTAKSAPAVDTDGLEQQMLLAAMALAQNPVVIVQDVQPEVQESGAAVELMPLQTEQTPQQSMAPTLDAETEAPQLQAVETPQTVAPQTETGKADSGESRGSELPMEELHTESRTEQADVEPQPVFRDIKAVPVKVGEVYQAEPTVENGVELKDLGDTLTQAIDRGENRLELQLQPAELGRIRVEMRWSDEGALHVILHAESTRTQNLLEKDMASLQTLLGRETQQEVKVELPREQEAPRQSFDDGRQNGGQQHQQEQRQSSRHSGQDFLHQLRLGLIPAEEAS
ncbi:flagellar hook-length control protein FliK [Oscillibacter valericigenes]|nr:flagellar hook-length control protein FliK [Oscillibacter valericigenes]